MTNDSTEISASECERKLRQYEQMVADLRAELELTRLQALRDSETALFSTAYFNARLREEILRSERYRHFLSLILIHVDLKHGGSTTQVAHALRQVGQELAGGLTRRTDIIALYRKRQMVVMLPETDGKGANLLASRFEAMFPSNGRRVSFSVLTFPQDASNIETVVSRLQEASEILFLETKP